MLDLKTTIQSADWKTEKHVPVIECPDTVKADEFFAIKATLGKAVSHPNAPEHHIRWIQLYFLPDGAKAPYQIGNFEFTAHGDSPDLATKGSVFTHHEVTASLKIGKAGTILALAHCNIHGLWQSAKEVKIS